MPRRPKVSSGSLSRDEKPVANKATWTFLSNHAHVLLRGLAGSAFSVGRHLRDV